AAAERPNQPIAADLLRRRQSFADGRLGRRQRGRFGVQERRRLQLRGRPQRLAAISAERRPLTGILQNVMALDADDLHDLPPATHSEMHWEPHAHCYVIRAGNPVISAWQERVWTA